jgi:hypothetical protein
MKIAVDRNKRQKGCQKSHLEPSTGEVDEPKQVPVTATNPNRKVENKQLKASEVYEIVSSTRQEHFQLNIQARGQRRRIA